MRKPKYRVVRNWPSPTAGQRRTALQARPALEHVCPLHRRPLRAREEHANIRLKHKNCKPEDCQQFRPEADKLLCEGPGSGHSGVCRSHSLCHHSPVPLALTQQPHVRGADTALCSCAGGVATTGSHACPRPLPCASTGFTQDS